jgi:hypothetical protein
VPIVLKSRSLNLLEPSVPVKACYGIYLTFYSGTTLPTFRDNLSVQERLSQGGTRERIKNREVGETPQRMRESQRRKKGRTWEIERRQKRDDRRQKRDDRRQKTDDRRQKRDDRRQKRDDRRQNRDDMRQNRDDRRQKRDGRRQKRDGRRQKRDDRRQKRRRETEERRQKT